MDTGAREALEREVRRLSEAGETAAAAAVAVRGYGPEILGFLAAMHASAADADDVFSSWAERIFRGLPGFGWESSLRTWAYTIARNASANFVRGRRNRARRELAAESAELAAVEQQVRTETRPYLRTEARDKLAAIRDALPPEDRALLVLRVDKRLEWKDLARVMLGDGDGVTDAALTRESQRLRKRFQILKEKLVEAGRREGILGGGGHS
jgi:RNA polymerase sigma-70 factor (ECF subfamily)